jgi:hypothetical protein
MSEATAQDDVAKGRFIILQIVRLSGFLFALAGLAIVAGKIALPQPVGYVLLLMGVGDAMVIPLILTRRWKTPTQ